VHWVFAQPTDIPPAGFPRPGSSVRLSASTEQDGSGQLGTLIHYMDDSPDREGAMSLVADVVGSGIGVYALSELVAVVEEADEDLHTWDFGPGGLDRPVRRRTD
jgi:hypothetical protein